MRFIEDLAPSDSLRMERLAMDPVARGLLARALLIVVAALGGCSSHSSGGPTGPSPWMLPSGAVVPGSALAGRSAPVPPGTEGTGCPEPGATIQCCENGRRTCTASGQEFSTWGPCRANKGGKILLCDPPIPDGGLSCETSEFGCHDASLPDGGLNCATNEFAPGCRDGGMSLCADKVVNNEPEVLAGYTPAAGQAVGVHGQIIAWLTDEHPFPIAPGEQLDLTTGDVLVPGDRTARASDGYLWEPALYIAPETAESGGRPHFPQKIKGTYNNDPIRGGKKLLPMQGAPLDPAPAGVKLSEKFNAEAIWDVDVLGLAPGTYSAQFVIRDGDDDRGVGCVTIVIAP
jgi:hypothetical protein